MADNSGMKKKILAVDDEVDFLELLKVRLEVNGYEVVTAIDGEEALRKTKDENPDLVILDIMLPKLNGEEVCRSIRNDPVCSKIPIIMLTAKGTDVDRIIGRVIGADAYLVKPFDAQHLLSAIKKLL